MRKKSFVTVTDLFCGAGGSSQGAIDAGAEISMAVNHWRLAVETHATNFPDTDHDCNDISNSDPRRYPSTDILIASPECLAAGTLIVTKQGLKAIEQVQVGDLVLTHRNRWHRVRDVMTRQARTVVVAGRGHYGLKMTVEHPVWIRQASMVWDSTMRMDVRSLSLPAWMNAGVLNRACFWATPRTFGDEILPIPPVGGRGAEFTPEFWWMVGRWLGDGNLRLRVSQPKSERRDKRPHRGWPAPCEHCGELASQHRRYPHLANTYCGKNCKHKAEAGTNLARGSSVQISCGYHEASDLEQRLAFAPPTGARARGSEYRWSRSNKRTAVVFDCPHNGLALWLRENFGQHAYGKRLPGWALTMPAEWRCALLDGYVSADGALDVKRQKMQVTSVSKELAFGIRLLAESCGHRTTLHRSSRQEGVIEGRVVPMRPLYAVHWLLDPQRMYTEDSEHHSWGRIQRIGEGADEIVFNLSVEEDESYVADGIVVHNCTNHSLAKGKRRKNQSQLSLFDSNRPDPSQERSRATMWDVPRFAEYHDYNAIIVENVVDVRHWRMWDAWLHAMMLLGYEHQIVYLNSMFFWPTPQSRDRLYVVFWKQGLPRPDLDYQPLAYCPDCGKDIEAIQSWKNPHRKWGRYGKRNQYVYRCPQCAEIVNPYYHPASTAIDWSLVGERIGDRKNPLKPRTMERIRYGLEKFGRQPQTVQLDYTHSSTPRAWPVSRALPTQTSRQVFGLLSPFLVSYYSRDDAASGITEAMPVITTEPRHALVQPFLMSVNHSTDRVRPVDVPLPTQTSVNAPYLVAPFLVSFYGGNGYQTKTFPATDALHAITTWDHHGLVVPPAFLFNYYGARPAVRSADDALATVTSFGNHALVQFMVSYYGQDLARHISQPMGTLTTVDRHAMVEAPSIDPEDCYFRMLTPEEVKRGMAFPEEYIILGNSRDRVKQAGNAVTPPAMRWLMSRAMQVFA